MIIDLKTGQTIDANSQKATRMTFISAAAGYSSLTVHADTFSTTLVPIVGWKISDDFGYAPEPITIEGQAGDDAAIVEPNGVVWSKFGMFASIEAFTRYLRKAFAAA